MLINLELEDVPENTNIYVFSNFNLVARKMALRPWELKIVTCNHCGECCKHYHDSKGLLPTTKENGCSNLKQRDDGTWWCKAHIPISCLVSNVHHSADYCNVRWKEVEPT